MLHMRFNNKFEKSIIGVYKTDDFKCLVWHGARGTSSPLLSANTKRFQLSKKENVTTTRDRIIHRRNSQVCCLDFHFHFYDFS